MGFPELSHGSPQGGLSSGALQSCEPIKLTDVIVFALVERCGVKQASTLRYMLIKAPVSGKTLMFAHLLWTHSLLLKNFNSDQTGEIENMVVMDS